MKKRNVILQAAVAGALLTMFGSANAASAINATSVKYAAEQFAGTTPYAAAVGPTVTVITATAIPAGSILTAVVELNGAVFAAAQVGATTAGTAANKIDATTGTPGVAPDCSMGSITAGVTAAAAGVTAPTATASNANVVSCQFTTSQAIGIGGTVIRIATPSLNAPSLSSTSATVTANATILVGSVAAPVGAAVATTGTLEASSGATTIATSATGIALTAGAGTTGKIDLTATPVASAFADAYSTTVVDLGFVKATDGTAKLVTAGNGAYIIAAKATSTVVATVSAPAGFFAALKTTGTISLHDTTCGAAALATTATFASNTLASAATSVSTPAAVPATGVSYRVCMTIPASGSTSVALIPATPTITATLGAAAAQDSVETVASTNLWALAYNGSQYDVRNYVPAAATGYNTFVRVINTGSISAVVSVALVDDVTGVAGTSGALGTLAAGASRNFSPQDIEAVTGAVASTSRPRLRITAPTNTMNVQTYLAQPVGAGVISDMTGGQ